MIILIERTCEAPGCGNKFKVWPESSKAFYCCARHGQGLKMWDDFNDRKYIFKKKKSEYEPEVDGIINE